jgi:hypothetical protein
MGVTLGGVFTLIGLIVEEGFDAFRGFLIGPSSAALALIVAGGLTWRFYWRTVQREANVATEERAAGMRKLYVYGTLALGLLGALILAQQLLSEFLIRLLNIGLGGYKPWTPLLIAAVLGVVWYWHRQIADKEQAAGHDGARGADLRRGYWFALAAYGTYGATTGLVTFIAGLLSHLGGQAPGSFGLFEGSSWMQTLFPPLAQIVVSSIAIWLFWLPSQRAAASGDEVERASRARSWLIHLLVFSATVSALSGAQASLTDILNRLLLGFSDPLLVLTINGPLASLIVGGLLLLYFFREVRPTLIARRLSEYILAGVALFIAVFGVQMLVAALFQALGGEGPRIEGLIANVLPPLLIGGAFWRWRWVRIEAEASGEDGSAARSDLWRKVYLYFYQLVGLALILVGGVALLAGIIAAILGQPIGGNVLVALSDPLASLLVGSGLLIYMMQIVASDGRLGALSVEEVMQHTLGDATPTWAIAAVAGVFLGPVFLILALVALGPVINNIFDNIVRNLG